MCFLLDPCVKTLIDVNECPKHTAKHAFDPDLSLRTINDVKECPNHRTNNFSWLDFGHSLRTVI